MLVDLLLLLGITVIVPLALPLHPGMPDWAAPSAVMAAVPVVLAYIIGRGEVSTALVVPWVAVSAVLLVAAVRHWLTGPTLRGLVWVGGNAYLVVGTSWLLFDRATMAVAGFGQPFVLLTAVHFHYAGFLTAVLVGCLWRHRPHDRWAAAAAIGAIASPPIVAVGFTWVGWLQVVGAILMTLAVWVAAGVMLARVVRDVDRASAWLLGLSAVSVIVPMILAVQWAVGQNLGTPALSIPDMARTHGVLNAVGFCLLGVLGWRRVHGPLDRVRAVR
jgi:hypothetical protein